MIKIYAIKLLRDNEKHELDYLINFISVEKCNRINRYKRWEDFQRSLLSDVLTRSIICDRTYIFNSK